MKARPRQPLHAALRDFERADALGDASVSAMRRRFDLPALEVASPERVLDALLRIGDLVGGPKGLTHVFPTLVTIMKEVIPIAAVGLGVWAGARAPFVRASCLRPGAADDARVAAIVDAATAYFRNGASLDAYETLTSDARRRWTCLPLTCDEGIVGLLAVESLSAVEERQTAFVACVARHIAGRLARDIALDTALVAERAARRDAETVANAKSMLTELTSRVLSSFDAMSSLRSVSHFLGEFVASGCIIDVEGPGGYMQRIIHAPLHTEPELSAAVGPLVTDVMFARRSVAAFDTADAETRSAAVEEARASLGMDWLACSPILGPRGPVGAVALFGWEHQHPPVSAALMDAITRPIGLAVENGRLYTKTTSALRARDEALSAVSHDLKNPLSVILLSTAHMLESMPPASGESQVDEGRGRRQIEAIQRNARRMQRLVGDLLDFAALEEVALSIQPRFVDLGALVRESVEDERGIAADAGVELALHVPVDLPRVTTDPSRIQQVIINLLGNAIKFTPRGGSVEVGITRSSGDEVAVSVRDTGPGIAPEKLPHVFERFWQGEPASGKGSGLGLAICRLIMERLGGRIWLRSNVGEGTIATFTVPVAVAEPRNDDGAA